MQQKNSVTILGSGTSTGVPTLGCQCEVCRSTNTKDKRLRSSILIKTSNDQSIIVDTSPDLRTQLLREKVSNVDAAIITHEHADHTHGIDDLRPFCFYKDQPIPVYTHDECAATLRGKFPYIFQRDEVFKNKKVLGGGIPKLDLYQIQQDNQVIQNNTFQFFELPHGHTKTLGFVHSKLAYIIDCNEVPEEVLDKLADLKLDVLIIDCLRKKQHSTHLHLELSLEYAQRIKAKQTGLTHLSHDFKHDDLTRELEEKGLTNIGPVYDGQVISYS